jgi:RHH-type proline utilization regulon transcriptional repressor/proline dehydrogenase/delta 1-pyrroline-5-carboxylate dehydrogenase
VPDNHIAYATDVPAGLKSALAMLNKGLTVMPKTAMAGTITVGASTNRVRLVGFPGRFRRSMRQSSVSLSVYDHDVTESGHIELLPYFREQSVSITAHRFGNPVQWVRDLSLD